MTETFCVDRLIDLDRQTKKRIAVIGDSMIDEWVHGTLTSCQDHCPKFVEKRRLTTPGGAAGAARQLARWNADAFLLGPWAPQQGEGWNQVGGASHAARRSPRKTRFLDENDRIIWRHDLDNGYGIDAQGIDTIREQVMEIIKRDQPDAILISDYDKGFLNAETIRKVIEIGNGQGIPVVADAKRSPNVYKGAILKGNHDYAERFLWSFETCQIEKAVITHGSERPSFHDATGVQSSLAVWKDREVQCRSHVGAGDAFAAHLTLGLAHGLSLWDAAMIAHSAGRVYVQTLHGVPVWPHQIRKDLDPAGGKALEGDFAGALRRSVSGRIVFTNGCFRIPHAGHAWLMNWAKQQGDVLVVGLNADDSLQRVKPLEPYLPLPERLGILSTFSPVDWIIPFEDDDPCAIMQALKPDLLVKGSEYAGQTVPGADLAGEVRFAPSSPFENHCSDLVTAIRGG